MRRLLTNLGLVLLASVLCGACGTASAPSGNTSSPVPIELPSVMTGKLADVPMASGPVVAAASDNLAAPKSIRKTSSTDYGIQLGSGSNSDFPAGSAVSACGTLNSLRAALGYAAFSDYAICVLRHVFDDTALNDDEYYYLTLSGTPTPRFGNAKFKLSLDDDGKITAFETFACNSQGEHSSQLYYISQTRSGTMLSGRNMYVTPDGNTMGSARADTDVTYTATLNDRNQYTSKVVTTSSLYGTESSSIFRYGTHVYSQPSSTRYTLSTTGGGTVDGTSSTSVSTVAGDLVEYNTDLSIDAYNVNLLGMSDGASRVVNYDASGTQTVDYSQGWSWDGSKMAPDATNADLATVQSTTLPSQISSRDIGIAFGSGQTWDCSIPDDTAADHRTATTFESFDVSQCDALIALYDSASLDCEELGLEF